MSLLWILIPLAILADTGAVLTTESDPTDALLTEHICAAIAKLNDPSFPRREQAVDELFAAGFNAVYPLKLAIEQGSPETAVRAFDVLQRLYRSDDESTYEAVEQALRQLKHVENLAVTTRAERAVDSLTELRQSRAVEKLERLGAIIHFSDPSHDRQSLGRPKIDHVMIGRDWTGREEDVRLIERIEDLRISDMPTLYIIRGIEISDATLLDLKSELPALNIERRGPARLGVASSANLREGGCVIGRIEAGSAAEGAGLQTADEVIEIDGQKVESFKELVEVIGKKEPGDHVPIVFRRNGEIREVVAELSSWSKKTVAKAPQPKP